MWVNTVAELPRGFDFDFWVGFVHRVHMQLDLQSAQLYSLAKTPQPTPAFGLKSEGAIAYWSAKIDDVSL